MKLNINKTKALIIINAIKNGDSCETITKKVYNRTDCLFCTAGNCAENNKCLPGTNMLKIIFPHGGCFRLRAIIIRYPERVISIVKKTNYKKFLSRKGQEEILMKIREVERKF